MIPLPAGVRVWLTSGHTDMRFPWLDDRFNVARSAAPDRAYMS